MRENRREQEGIRCSTPRCSTDLAQLHPCTNAQSPPGTRSLPLCIHTSNPQTCPSRPAWVDLNLPPGNLLLGFLSSRGKPGCWWGASRSCFV